MCCTMENKIIPDLSPQTFEVLPRLTLTVCTTDRFKVGKLRVRAMLRNTNELIAPCALLLPVLHRGTREYPTQERINRYLDDLYATDCHICNSTVGDLRIFGFASNMIESSFLPDGERLLPAIISLIVQLFFSPTTEADGKLIDRYVESERRHLIDAIESLSNHPASYAMTRFRAAFSHGRDTGKPIRVAQLKAVGENDLRALLQKIREQAHFHVFYIGQTPPDALICRLRCEFAPLLGEGASQVTNACVKTYQPRRTPFCVTESLEVGQSHLILGYRTDITITSPAFYAMMLCNELLGGNPSARVVVHLRERQSLCYSCQSEYVLDRGELIVSCGIDRSCRQAAQAEIEAQITALQQGTFDDAELEAARRLLLGGYAQIEDSTRAITSFYQVRQLLGISENIRDCCRAFMQVTREQVIAAARSLVLDTVYFLDGTLAGKEQEGVAQESEVIDDGL